MTDFYYENGYRVFTSEYLISRGYCCACGCRHCPYIENNGEICHNTSGDPDTIAANITEGTYEEQNDPKQIQSDILDNQNEK
jgi:hypothetical protein